MTTEAVAPMCPEHPALPSVSTCIRCGRFLCRGCVGDPDPVRCLACSEFERQRDLLGAQPFSFGGTLAQAATLLSASFGPLVRLALLMGLLWALAEWGMVCWLGKAGVKFAPWVLALASLGFYGAAILVVVRSAKGEPVHLGAALAEGYGSWGSIFAVRFKTGLITSICMLLLVVPGLLKWAEYCVAVPVVMLEPNRSALDRSTRLTRDRRWQILGALLVTYVPVVMLVAFGGVVVRRPLAELQLGLQPAWLALLFVGRLLLAFSEMLWWTMAVALYSGLLASERAAAKAEEPLLAIAVS